MSQCQNRTENAFPTAANRDSLDWKDLAAEDIVARVLKRVKPGSIMLFHNGAKNTPEALPKILEKLIADGYKIVPVGELIYRENYTIDHRGRQLPAGSEPAPSSAVPSPSMPNSDGSETSSEPSAAPESLPNAQSDSKQSAADSGNDRTSPSPASDADDSHSTDSHSTSGSVSLFTESIHQRLIA